MVHGTQLAMLAMQLLYDIGMPHHKCIDTLLAVMLVCFHHRQGLTDHDAVFLASCILHSSRTRKQHQMSLTAFYVLFLCIAFVCLLLCIASMYSFCVR